MKKSGFRTRVPHVPLRHQPLLPVANDDALRAVARGSRANVRQPFDVRPACPRQPPRGFVHHLRVGASQPRHVGSGGGERLRGKAREHVARRAERRHKAGRLARLPVRGGSLPGVGERVEGAAAGGGAAAAEDPAKGSAVCGTHRRRLLLHRRAAGGGAAAGAPAAQVARPLGFRAPVVAARRAAGAQCQRLERLLLAARRLQLGPHARRDVRVGEQPGGGGRVRREGGANHALRLGHAHPLGARPVVVAAGERRERGHRLHQRRGWREAERSAQRARREALDADDAVRAELHVFQHARSAERHRVAVVGQHGGGEAGDHEGGGVRLALVALRRPQHRAAARRQHLRRQPLQALELAVLEAAAARG